MGEIVNNVDNILQQYSGTATGISKTQAMGKEDFLQMLVAQLKTQDPMDGTDFTAQLAQFSSLEQLTNLNQGLMNQGLYQSTQANVQAVNLIGKEVTAGEGNDFIADGSPVNVYYDLSEDAAEVQVDIYDEHGIFLDTVLAYDQKQGVNNLTWNNDQEKSGNYTFKASAYGTDGENLIVDTLISGKVSAVSFKENSIYVNIAGREVPFSEVSEVKG